MNIASYIKNFHGNMPHRYREKVKNSFQLKSEGSLNYLWLNSNYALCVCVTHTFALAEDNYDIWLRIFYDTFRVFLDIARTSVEFFSIYENV